jgi:hypothetical protein
LSSDNIPGPQSRTGIDELLDPSPASNSPATPATSASEIARLRDILRTVVAERDAAVHELSTLRGQPAGNPTASNSSRTPVPSSPAFSPPRREERSAPMTAMTELPSPPRLPGTTQPPAKVESPVLEASRFEAPRPEPARIAGPAPNHRLAGFWFYVKPTQGQKNRNQTLYPPEYIEAAITEDNGVVHGRYRSRFRIVDRAISPEVNFSFTGTPGGSAIVCPWTGPGGAKGELTLYLVSDNSIKVDWKATELGTQQGLISGTAILTRKVE